MFLYIVLCPGRRLNFLHIPLKSFILNKEYKIWTFPDPNKIEVQETGKDQILLKKIKVEYLSSINIKCEICDSDAIKFLNEEIMKLNKEK